MPFETHKNWKPRNFGRYGDGTKIEDVTLEDRDVTSVEDVEKMLQILDAANMDYIIECETSHVEDKNGNIENVRVDIIEIEVPASADTGKYPYRVYLTYCPPWIFGPYRWELFGKSGIDFKRLLKFIQKFPEFVDVLAAGESDD